jgi:hypothetical protein
MKRGLHILTVSLGLCGTVALGHDVPVHRRITQKAAASALAGSAGFTKFLATVSADCDLAAATNYLVEGSAREHDPDANHPKDAGGYRSMNHFYDPLTRRGLSDAPPDFRSLQGTNSFTWASVSNCAGLSLSYNPNPTNAWSWQNARGYEWLGLTSANASERHANLTNMFRAVGHVAHLLQDTSQPQHVRNEQHLETYPFTRISTPWRSPIEIYGRDKVERLNYQSGLVD